ncbi:MAG: MFS transporter [Oscillospiraceae bacterium]|nr:MFS transporter [Oscillospiraceae bacterium]
MAILEKSKLFQSPKMDSRIKSANVQKSEQWLGYFTSPMLLYMAYYAMSGSYLNQFYVDVLKLGGVAGGLFLVLLPVLSKVFDAVTNLLMGVIIDRTRTRQGKIRPWILIAGPLVTLTGIMLYCVPKMSLMGQAIWVAVSYNLYFAFAFTMYNMTQMLLVPLSTRNTKQRDGLAMMVSMGQSMLPGALIYMIFPLVFLPMMGADQASWARVMSIVSCLFLPGAILQYYFTKERVSEDAAAGHEETASLWTQIKTCFSDKYWLYYFAIIFFYQFSQNVYSVAVNFYANYAMGTYNDGFTLTILNAVGQFPLGLGVFLLWPIARKYGKRWTFFVGMLIAFAGGMGMYFLSKPGNLVPVLAASFIKAFGMLPTYLFAGMMADAMDHIEWERGYRCDGFTATMNSVMITVMAGVGTTVFNAGLRTGKVGGYVAPLTGTSITDIFAELSEKGLTAQLAMDAYAPNADGVFTVGVLQTVAVNRWLVICVALIPAITYLISAVFGYFNDVGDQIPQISKDIQERHRAAAEARGEVYVSPEEKAAQEQAENDRIAEENRIAELKARCEKKGLNFEEEEARYQAKLAEQKAKAEAKAAKKNKKK